MAGSHFLTIAQQVAEHLRGELMGGRWGGMLPGLPTLSAELRVNHKTVEVALRLLEKEGILIPQGPGKRRLIRLPKRLSQSSLRVAILAGEVADQRKDYMVELQHKLVAAGHVAFYAPKVMVELGMDAKRICRMAKQVEADAWVIVAGSFDVLKWFSARKIPSFALFGRRRGLPMAGVGPDKPPAYAAATRALAKLGHRRIVLMTRWRRRVPLPGASEQAFLDELTAQGIAPSSFNLPDWEVSTEGFHGCLDALFKITPPTALIIDEAPFFIAAQQFLASIGLRVPEDVSMICTDEDTAFAWCSPEVTHIRWDSRPVVRRIARWAVNVSSGKEDKRQTLTPAEFVPGGTIGPAPKED